LTRTAPRDAAGGGIAALLILGLAFRLIIAALLPGSGFKIDIDSFAYWAQNLASQGPYGFYDRPFFHDYTPGYLYVLWLIGVVGGLIGQAVSLLGHSFGLVDLLKVAPILGDVTLAYLAWSMARELGASERAARIGAFIVVVNPVTWVDSVLWGQVDSVGVVFLVLGLREVWRDRPERSAILAMLAALIKPQLGILIPIVAVVTIRRALWPSGGYGDDDPAEVVASGRTAWERRVHGPLRILTTGAAGLLTAIAVSLPFGLSLPGLIAQIFKTAAGYPYLSVNAYNPWALVSQGGHGIAADRSWVCDSTVVPSGPVELRIGDFLVYSAPASTQSCPDGFMIGAIPAVLVGAFALLAVGAIVLWLVARRPDRRTMLVGLTVLALAFFVLPTRVHERYLFPLVGVGAVLAAVSLRWRLMYVAASAAMLANMYAVLTTLYPNNPGISDWLRIGDVVTSWGGVAAAAVTVAVVFGWALVQLRDEALEHLADEVVGTGGAGPLAPMAAVVGNLLAPPASGPTMGSQGARSMLPAAPAESVRPDPSVELGASVEPGEPAFVPSWGDRGAGDSGPLAWIRERFRDRPVRADRSAALARELGGRLDRLDLWLIAVLIVSLATVRLWRLSEPYDMHFDEVYHPRTGMEFLQYWRYGISHDIYEWTHPHLAKYAMALGIVAFGEDRTTATADLGLGTLADAAVEPRWYDLLHDRSGDRLWIVGGDEVRAYDLATRAVVGSWPLAGASAIGVDQTDHQVFVGTASGEIWTIDTAALDSLRATGASLTGGPTGSGGEPVVAPARWATVKAPIRLIHPTQNGSAVEVVAGADAKSSLVTLATGSASETARVSMPGVRQIADSGNGTVAVAHTGGVAIVLSGTGKVVSTIAIDGTVGGIAATEGLADNPLYVSTLTSDGPQLITLTTRAGDSFPSRNTSFSLPGGGAGPVFYDDATRMVHAVGTAPPTGGAGGWFEPSTPGSPTIYVIDPTGGSNAVYADAQLPFGPAVIAMDVNHDYPSSDRQQLLAFSTSGEMATVPVGEHAFAWRIPGVIAGVLMGALLYVLARLLFRRREIAVILGFLLVADGMLFVQSRIGMNDSYVGLFIVAAYVLFAWLWFRPGGSRRHWLAFAIGMPIIGLTLGLALASKWVAAYAIGSLGILVLARSALGRLILLLGLIAATTALGYLAISVPEGKAGPNYLFLAIMVGLTLASAVAMVLHPIRWTWQEQRLAVYGPIAAGLLVVLAALATGRLDHHYHLGRFAASPPEIGFAAIILGLAVYSSFVVAGRSGFGPMARPPAPDSPAVYLEQPAPAPSGWLDLGSGFGLPAIWTLACLVVIPVVVYVISYVPWAWVDNHQLLPELWPGWPGGHTGTGPWDTLVNLTQSMYSYHNDLTSAHPASSPWWAWPFDLKPVWFYQDSFAGGTSASIYDAGNLVSWWLGIPAMAFAALQAFKRRNVGLGLVVVAFACQWLGWARIDRAAFQYHYYTALPFLLIALAYFIAELWHGPSWRTWILARLAGAAVVLGPFAFWLLHRPLCAIAQVDAINPGSSSCPTTIPDLGLSPRTLAIAVVLGVGVLLILRLLLASGGSEAEGERGAAGPVARAGRRLVRAAVIAGAVVVGLTVISIVLPATAGLNLTALPVEPIALIVMIALVPVAAYVATARDSRRFAAGMLAAIGLWFIAWYPNISALPLPSSLTNVYQGLLPTYIYSFQFWVNQTPRGAAPSLFGAWPAFLLLAMTAVTVAVGYSAWQWRLALGERRREAATWRGEEGAGSTA
jgi:Gpi18-like mannosyltransferase/predicted membrane-bound dolichyl-phosphate-mannose-protein mannosyltransferase